MSEYAVYNCTVRGARYVKKGKPCEDASVSWGENGINIAVVADGHGDKACFRSNVGSKFACQISASSLRNFAESVRDQGNEELLFGSHQEELVTQLFRTILGRWTTEVLLHLENNIDIERRLGKKQNTKLSE